MDTKQQAVSLPSAPAKRISPNVILQPPLSRRGHGLGLFLILPDDDGARQEAGRPSTTLDPHPRQKWAEEGYAVVEIRTSPASAREGKKGVSSVRSLLLIGLEALMGLPQCDTKDRAGLLGDSVLTHTK